MEKRFTVLRILIPGHSLMSGCLPEMTLNKPLMQVTETLRLVLDFLFGPKYEGTIRLELLTVGAHSSESVLI